MNMQLNMLLTLMSAASLALVACEKPASTTVAEATPTPTTTPAPIAPVVDEKAANWKIIEDMRKGIVQSTPTPSPTVIPHLLMGDNKANYKVPTPVTTTKHKTNQPGAIVDNVADADATHIYFGPADSISKITAEEMKADYDENPKAFAQGWRDGWNWGSKQTDFSSDEPAEKQERKLYGDIDSDPGETKAIAFFEAFSIWRHRHNDQETAEEKPAPAGSADTLDKVGSSPYQWTLRYIEQAAGVGVGQLIAPNVTFGPYATAYNKQKCWMVKVTFHVPGDNRQHLAIVYEEPVIGPEHVIGCVIDF
jgi:hypothetical protein